MNIRTLFAQKPPAWNVFRTRTVVDIKRILKPAQIALDLPGETKDQIIAAMVDLAMTTGRVADRQEALHAVLEREAKMSTGMQYGVAIPHGKSDAVQELVACIGLKPEGVDFQSLDGNPSRIFVMTISPLSSTGPHVQFLAEISKVLKDAENRERILASQTPEELLAQL